MTFIMSAIYCTQCFFKRRIRKEKEEFTKKLLSGDEKLGQECDNDDSELKELKRGFDIGIFNLDFKDFKVVDQLRLRFILLSIFRIYLIL